MYYRITSKNSTQIVVDAPPEKEPLHAFLHVSKQLKKNGVNTPTIHAIDVEQGFAILDDFGDNLMLNALTPTNMHTIYSKAIKTLIQVQKTNADKLPVFDKAHMLTELSLFNDWFISQFLHIKLTPDEQSIIANAFFWLVTQIDAQPKMFMHGDYHSRNLMLLDNSDHTIGVIDFQDAMLGPITYDLVSLLKDCYIKLTDDHFFEMIALFYNAQSHVLKWTQQEIINAMNLCGIQRHCRILGTFSRLILRDNKKKFIHDLPQVMTYILASISQFEALTELQQLMLNRIVPAFKAVNKLPTAST